MTPKYENLDSLRELVKEVTNLSNYTIHFFDQEEDQIFISDSHDLEYFIDQFKTSQFAPIIVEESEQEVSDEKTEKEILEEIPKKEDKIEQSEFIDMDVDKENEYKLELDDLEVKEE